MSGDLPDLMGAVALLRVLANPSRLRIALRLLDGERSVGELETDLAVRQPNLSQHLGELREAGLVATRRESRSIHYRLSGDEAERLVAALRDGLGGTAPVSRTVPAPARPPRRAGAASTFAVVRLPQ